MSLTREGFTKVLVQRVAPRLGERVYANVADWIDRGEVSIEVATDTLADLYSVDPADRAKVRAEIEARLAPKEPA